MKPRLLLLHGALGSASQLRSLQEAFSDSFDCHSFDFLGHGSNSGTGEFSMKSLSVQIGEELNFLGWDDCAVFGYSMGGYAALCYMMDNPGRIRRLYTLGTKFDWTPETAEKESRMLNPQKIEEKVPAFAQALSQRHGESNWKHLLNNTASMMKGLGLKPELSSERLKTLHTPVRIGRGEKDNMVSKMESVQAAVDLPLGSYTEWAQVHHPIEKVPVKMAVQAVSGFLRQA